MPTALQLAGAISVKIGLAIVIFGVLRRGLHRRCWSFLVYLLAVLIFSSVEMAAQMLDGVAALEWFRSWNFWHVEQTVFEVLDAFAPPQTEHERRQGDETGHDQYSADRGNRKIGVRPLNETHDDAGKTLVQFAVEEASAAQLQKDSAVLPSEDELRDDGDRDDHRERGAERAPSPLQHEPRKVDEREKLRHRRDADGRAAGGLASAPIERVCREEQHQLE